MVGEREKEIRSCFTHFHASRCSIGQAGPAVLHRLRAWLAGAVLPGSPLARLPCWRRRQEDERITLYTGGSHGALEDQTRITLHTGGSHGALEDQTRITLHTGASHG